MSSLAPWPLKTTTRDRADKPAFLTSAARSGIGEEVARPFAPRRPRIVPVPRSREALERFASRRLGITEVVGADVTPKDPAEPSVGPAMEASRRLEFLVNNAGDGSWTTTTFLSRDALTFESAASSSAGVIEK